MSEFEEIKSDVSTEAEEDDHKIEIRSEVVSHITFASHQNHVGIITDLAVINPSSEDLKDLTLHLVTEPEVASERTWTFDQVSAESTYPVRDLAITLKGSVLKTLTERMRTDLVMELRKGDKIVAQKTHSIEALAWNEWGGQRYMPELLAAFVTPNDPAIMELIRNASMILQENGRKSSMEGYQDGDSKRVWELVSGIWAAVTKENITYANPPASFESVGQKVRLPSMIKQHRLASCLDTALLFAAAIEHAGISPIIVLIQGHALCGFWLRPQLHIQGLMTDDPMEVRKAIDGRELVLFEPTQATAGHSMPFTSAIKSATSQLKEENEDQFVYAIDIARARGLKIQPLSTSEKLVPSSLSETETSENTLLPLDQPPELPEFALEIATDTSTLTPVERLDRWKRSLLDLSKRNRLLNLRKSLTAISIFCTDLGKLEDKIADGKNIALITPPEKHAEGVEADPDIFRMKTGDEYSENYARDALSKNEIVANVPTPELKKGLVALYRKAKSDLEEGGSNTLFLAIGFLRWQPISGPARKYRAPLILLPVNLTRSSARTTPKLSAHDDEPVFNRTLIQMLRQDFDVEIPELSKDLPTDHSGIDVKKILEIVKRKVRDIPGFEVVNEMVLSTFSFKKYLMWKDLVDRTEALKSSPIVRHLIDTPRDSYDGGADFIDPDEIDEKIDPADLLAPLKADSCQIVAIHASGQGGDYVLEGPPGTGKSETIANIIAHNLGLGRRILFISEKMAALDVVYKRLKDCNLGDFCLELHSAKANKKEVIQKLGAAWTSREQHTPTEWNTLSSELKDIQIKLNNLVSAIHEPGPAGISPYDAIGRSLRYQDVHHLDLDWDFDNQGQGRAPTREVLTDLEKSARHLALKYDELENEDFTAFEGIENTEWSYSWQSQFSTTAKTLSTALSILKKNASDFSAGMGFHKIGNTFGEYSALNSLAILVPDCATANARFGLAARGLEFIETLEQACSSLEEYRKLKLQNSLEKYSDQRILDMPMSEWTNSRDLASSKMWPLRIFAFRKLRKMIRSHFALPNTIGRKPEEALELLQDLSRRQGLLNDLTRKLPEHAPWDNLETDTEQALKNTSIARKLREVGTWLANHDKDLIETLSILSRTLFAEGDRIQPGMPLANTALELIGSQGTFVTNQEEFQRLAQQEEETNDLDQLEKRLEIIIDRSTRLNPWCQWVQGQREAREAGLGALVDALRNESITPDQAQEVFRTAYCRWVAPILIDARPELVKFSAISHQELIEEFRSLDRELAKTVSSQIRATLSGKVLTQEKAGLDKNKQYGVLSREMQKQRAHMPVRKLIESMGDVLLQLTPCLLMSPLSVAQFLSANQKLFDLVVFDEASQITVPDAIGAIARGKNCIIVGDQKQMPPTRFFERGPDEDDNEEARDLESILDEAIASQVKRHQLTGHYRSKHESLITFSNHAYYGGSLVTFPSAETKETAVTFRRVDGIYARGKTRTNEIEARTVVEEVARRLRDPELSKLSIGIVTLNSEQQRLILDLLDVLRRGDPALERFFHWSDASGPSPVFVKNLETVQGDERDVILISIGYGPTEHGAQTMYHNFGPLNKDGGERRLNVAITRATTEVMVFASFDASMIDLTRTKSNAVEDLKNYIDYADRGKVALAQTIRSFGELRGYDSDFEKSVAEGLRKHNWNVRTQIGVSKFRVDLGIIHPDAPGKFLAGVECDGATYHSSRSARDRDRVRQEILERLGWKLFRIWSTDFFYDEKRKIQELHERLETLLKEDREKATELAKKRERTSATSIEPKNGIEEETGSNEIGKATNSGTFSSGQAADSAANSPGSEGAPSISDSTARALDSEDPTINPIDFYEPTYQRTLMSLATKIIDQEGPVTFNFLSKKIARIHNFQRTGREIKRKIWQASHNLRKKTRAPGGEEICWPEGMDPASVIEFRGLRVNDTQRNWEEVPHPEKLGLVRQVLNTNPKDPAREIANIIGYSRVEQAFRLEILGLTTRVHEL